jgi:hypothetical protein
MLLVVLPFLMLVLVVPQLFSMLLNLSDSQVI